MQYQMLHFPIKKSNLGTRVLQDEYFSFFCYILQDVFFFFSLLNVHKALDLSNRVHADCTPNQLGEFIPFSL